MATTTTTTTTLVPLLLFGRKRAIAKNLEAFLAPQFSFPAIVDEDNFPPSNVGVVLKALNIDPPLAGVLVGGGVDAEIQDEIEAIVKQYNQTADTKLGFVKAPLNLMVTMGREKALNWYREALCKEFNVPLEAA